MSNTVYQNPITVCITAYNEVANIPVLMSDLDLIQNRFPLMKCVVVDNASSDETLSLLMQESQNRPWLFVTHLAENIGYGGGLQEAITLANTDIVITFPADLQYSPQAVVMVVECLHLVSSSQQTLIYGHRVKRHDGVIGRLQSFVYLSICKTLLNLKSHDINGLPKLFPRELVLQHKDVLSKTFFMDAQILFLAQRSNFYIEAVPVEFLPRKLGVSSWSRKRLVTYLSVLGEVFTFRKKMRKTL